MEKILEIVLYIPSNLEGRQVGLFSQGHTKLVAEPNPELRYLALVIF